MSERKSAGFMSPVALIAWVVILEVLRRKELYVLLILMGLFAIGTIAARAADASSPDSGTFLTNLGVSMSFLCAAVLAVMTSVRLLPTEFENRTIYPLLAKPLARTQLIVGKWLAATGVSIVSMFVLFMIAWLPVPKPEALSGLLLVQALIAKSLALGMVAALGILFSLLMPKALNLVLLGLAYVGSDTLGNFLRARSLNTPFHDLVSWLVLYLPRFDMLDLAKRYTDQAPALSALEFTGLVSYPVVATAFILALAAVIFERRPL